MTDRMKYYAKQRSEPVATVPARPAITDSPIRAAVWFGEGTGTWWTDVYYAARRTHGTSPVDRSDTDGDLTADVIAKNFDTQLEALDYAAELVGSMRLSAALAIGMVSAAEMLDGLSERAAAVLGINPDPMEAP